MRLSSFSSYIVPFALGIVAVLVLFSVVPNSFSISLVGCGLSLLWLGQLVRAQQDVLVHLPTKPVLLGVGVWLLGIVLAECVHAYARFISPGFDLAWFAQAVTNARLGHGLHTSSEVFFPSTLVQHWEPILYTIVPLTLVFSGAVAVVLWQALGLCVGAVGAWRLARCLLPSSSNLSLFALLLYVLGFATINPVSFDCHPPVFGGLLCTPWLVWALLTNRRLLACGLLVVLALCGEIFFAIIPAYLGFLLLQRHINTGRLLLAGVLYGLGYLAIGAYQKFVGPLWGLPFSFSGRYEGIGGDGLGILNTFVHNPGAVLANFFAIPKLKTFLKLVIYYGALPFWATRSPATRRMGWCLWAGCLPYFVQIGVATDTEMASTNKHYLGALGAQWWCLSLLGLVAVQEHLKRIHLKASSLRFLLVCLACLFLNASEWRKSPLHPLRAWFEHDKADPSVRAYLAALPPSQGVLLVGTEWLCPLAVESRYYALCYSGHPEYVPVMPLQVVIARPSLLADFYSSLPSATKESPNGQVIKALSEGQEQALHWQRVWEGAQKNDRGEAVAYVVYEKQSPVLP